MVTAFGAQSLPSIDSPVWDDIGKRMAGGRRRAVVAIRGLSACQLGGARRRPALRASKPRVLHRASQDVPGALRPARRPSICGCASSSRAGVHLHFTWSIHFPPSASAVRRCARRRRPAAGRADARRSSRPASSSSRSAFEPDRPFGILQRPDVPFSARLVVVNDDPEIAGAGMVRWSVTRDARRRAARRQPHSRRDAAKVLLRRGEVRGADRVRAGGQRHHREPCRCTAEGDYMLEATLTVGGRGDRSHRAADSR